MFYFKFNIGDYASHTRHLSLIEDIAYRRLLDLAYSIEKPIRNDMREISRLINMRDYQTEIQDILSEFWVLVEGEGWINNRVMKEIEETGARSEKASRSAKSRWEHIKNAKIMRTQCENDANASKNDANASKNDANASKNDATHYPLPITQDTSKTKPSRKRSAITIQEFLIQCDQAGEKRIPENDAVFDYADKMGLQMEMVKVCWHEFVRSHVENKKRQSDWRATFRNYVRKNYYKLWYIEADGSVKETPQYRALKKIGDVNV